jgi:hypothetical protein
MSGAIQIETYARITHEQEFDSTLDRYIKLLQSLGFDPEEVTGKLADFTWETLVDDGFGGPIAFGEIETTDCTLGLAAGINGFNKATIPDDWPWLEFLLYLDNDELTWGPHSYRYRDNCVPPLWELVKRYSEVFQETGVYVTDPVGELKTWETLIHVRQDEASLWSFDLGLVPYHLADRFKNPPANYESAEFAFGIGFVDTEKINVLPWRS